MPNFSSPAGTTQDYIPLLPASQLGKAAGFSLHFPTIADLVAAVTKERANVSGSSPLWKQRQPFTVGTEPRILRTWSVSGNHARTVTIGFAEFVLAGDSNTVLTATGIPANGTGDRQS